MVSKKKKAKKPFVPLFSKEHILRMRETAEYKVGYLKGYLTALKQVRRVACRDGVGLVDVHSKWFDSLFKTISKRAKKIGL